MLAVVETHPIQYHAPVYRALQSRFGVPVTAIYGSDFSVVGYRDNEFDRTFAWDTDLLSGYASLFLARSGPRGASSTTTVSTHGLRQTLRRLDPKAILLVGYSPRFYQLAWFEALRTGRPLILRGETTDHALQRGWIKARLRDSGLRWLYARCARLLYVGLRSSQHFRRLGCPLEKLVFSPYCVDTTPFETDELARERLRSTTRRALGIGPHETVILLSGKIVQRKRPQLVLRAIKALPPEQRERVHVLCIGSGAEQSAFEAFAGEWPPVATTCAGFQNQTHLSRFYHAADVLVLPSNWEETWGLVINEALHHGLPCIVSEAVGSGPDLIVSGQTGEVFETDSATSLSGALQRAWPLIGQSLVRERCRQAVSGYSVDKAAAGIAQAYHEVANGT